jgi:hypothetical protein
MAIRQKDGAEINVKVKKLDNGQRKDVISFAKDDLLWLASKCSAEDDRVNLNTYPENVIDGQFGSFHKAYFSFYNIAEIQKLSKKPTVSKKSVKKSK